MPAHCRAVSCIQSRNLLPLQGHSHKDIEREVPSRLRKPKGGNAAWPRHPVCPPHPGPWQPIQSVARAKPALPPRVANGMAMSETKAREVTPGPLPTHREKQVAGSWTWLMRLTHMSSSARPAMMKPGRTASLGEASQRGGAPSAATMTQPTLKGLPPPTSVPGPQSHALAWEHFPHDPKANSSHSS